MENNTKFLPCPFCGEQPIISHVEDRDDRRYMVMELECCVTMSVAIGYGQYKNMTDMEIEADLASQLLKKWNERS